MRRPLLWLAAVVLVPLLAVQAGIYGAWFHSRQAEETEASLELARAVGASFESYLLDIRRQEFALGATLRRIVATDPAAANELLAETAGEYASVQFWRWTDARGKVVATSDPRSGFPELGDRDYFQEVAAGQPWALSDVIQDRATREPVVIIARRIENADRTLAGTMLAAVRVGRKIERLSILSDPAEGESLSIFDRHGVVAFRQAVEDHGHNDWSDDDALLRAALELGVEQTGKIVSPVDGEPYLAARVPLKDIGWVVGVERLRAAALADVYDGLWIVAGLNLLVIALSVAGAAVVGGTIVRPLGRLQDHARAIGRGDLAHRSPATRIRELDELAADFNRMAEDLARARQEQQEAHAALEMRVAERTAELAATVEKLKAEAAERASAESSLQAQSRMFEAFFENALTGMVFLDRDFNFIRVNRAYAESCQRDVDDFPGHNHFEFYPHEENEAIFREVLRTKSPYQALARAFRFPDHQEWGTTYWDWTLVPILGETGEVDFLVFSLKDVTDRVRAEQEVQAAHDSLKEYAERLRLLAAELTQTEKRERRRLAQVLHDHLQQLLVASRMRVGAAMRGISDQRALQSLAQVDELLNEAISESRSLAVQLSPPVLYEAGLPEALGWLAGQMEQKHGLSVSVSVADAFEKVPETARLLVFDAIRELLFNVVKHAGTRSASVELFAGGQGEICAVVTDEGRGFDPAETGNGGRASFGLFSIRERLELAGGRMTVESSPGRGTRATLAVPSDAAEAPSGPPEDAEKGLEPAVGEE